MHFGLEDLSHVQSRRNLLKYLVRVEMPSDWFMRIYRSILVEQMSSKIEIWRIVLLWATVATPLNQAMMRSR